MCLHIISVVYMFRFILCLKGFTLFYHIPHTWNAYVAGNLLKYKKIGKTKHGFYKDKTRSITLRRWLKCDVSWTLIDPENRLQLVAYLWSYASSSVLVLPEVRENAWNLSTCSLLLEKPIYCAFANSCPLQTDTFLLPLIHSHNAILSSNKF